MVGAVPRSLGSAVRAQAEDSGYEVTTAGLHDEDLKLDVLEDPDEEIGAVFKAMKPHHVVCTVGVNVPAEEGSLQQEDFDSWMLRSLAVNVIGPMNILRQFLQNRPKDSDGRNHFAAISSNSAHIARSNSMAYCASKAALSMAIRVAARENAESKFTIYGYELGLLKNTPMTKETENRFGPSQTRMPGAPEGLSVQQVAAQIVAGLGTRGLALNGCLLRLDAGEQ